MKIYLAGKISGDDRYREKFALAAQKFVGHKILNPAELPEGMDNSDYMRICLAMIDCADLVLFLPDSRFSAAAKIEKDYCDYIDKAYWLMEEGKND